MPTLFLTYMYALNSSRTVLTGPRRYKGGTNVYPQKRKKAFSPPFSFIIKMQSSLFWGWAPCLLAYTSHKVPTLINSFFACHVAHTEFFLWWDKRTWASVSSDSRWAVSTKRQWVRVASKSGMVGSRPGSSPNSRRSSVSLWIVVIIHTGNKNNTDDRYL